MALQLTTVSAVNGATGDYWRISRTQYDRSVNKTLVDVELWLDAATAATNLNSLGDRKHYYLDGEQDRAAAYTHLKTLPEWAEAEDC